MGVSGFGRELDLPALSGTQILNKGLTKSENSYFQQEYYSSTAVLFRMFGIFLFLFQPHGIVNRIPNCDLKDCEAQCVTHGYCVGWEKQLVQRLG